TAARHDAEVVVVRRVDDHVGAGGIAGREDAADVGGGNDALGAADVDRDAAAQPYRCERLAAERLRRDGRATEECRRERGAGENGRQRRLPDRVVDRGIDVEAFAAAAAGEQRELRAVRNEVDEAGDACPLERGQYLGGFGP